MRKILFGVFFLAVTIRYADASIISRGFLDEALESYATTTALDLKADKADLTALSDKIGNAWPYMFDMAPGLHSLSLGLYPPEMNLENTSDLVRFLFGGQMESGISGIGVLNALGQSVVDTGAYDVKTGQIDDGFRSLKQLTDGWTDSQRKTYLGVRGLNDAIGTLPEGITVQGMYEGWMSPSGIHTQGLSQVELDSFFVYNPRTDSAQNVEGLKGGLLHILNTMMSYGDYSPTVDEWVLAPFWKLTQSAYKIDELSTKIGTLPSGAMPLAPIWSDSLFQYMYQDFGIEPNYPTSLAGLMELLFGKNGTPGIFPLIYRGVSVDTDGNGSMDTSIGISANYYLATSANDIANAASAAAQTAQTTANTAKSTADSAIEKIGELPSEYATVGAALSAMDAKIDAHELPADSDDGQYVLSAKKVGDTITYTWVKMDLTDAEK